MTATTRVIRKTQAPEAPRCILFLAVGNPSNDGIVSLFNIQAREARQFYAETKIVMYTNCLNYTDFDFETYHVQGTRGMPLLGQIREIAVQAFLSGALDEADMIVVNYAGFFPYVSTLCIELLGGSREAGAIFRSAPVICYPSQVNWKSSSASNENMLFGEHLIYSTLFHAYPHQVLLYLLSTTENDHIDAARLAHAPELDIPKRRYNVYQFTGFQMDMSQKVNAVAWSGRANNFKDPVSGAHVLKALTKKDIQVDMWVPSGNFNAEMEEAARGMPEGSIHFSEPKKVYLEGLKKAKVALITSKLEAFAMGYLEMIERGLIPVVLDKPWSRAWLVPEWPLFYRTLPEAIMMCLDAIENYDMYLKMLEDVMNSRFGEATNFGGVLQEIWDDYRKGVFNRSISLEDNPARFAVEMEDVPDAPDVRSSV